MPLDVLGRTRATMTDSTSPVVELLLLYYYFSERNG